MCVKMEVKRARSGVASTFYLSCFFFGIKRHTTSISSAIRRFGLDALFFFLSPPVFIIRLEKHGYSSQSKLLVCFSHPHVDVILRKLVTIC